MHFASLSQASQLTGATNILKNTLNYIYGTYTFCEKIFFLFLGKLFVKIKPSPPMVGMAWRGHDDAVTRSAVPGACPRAHSDLTARAASCEAAARCHRAAMLSQSACTAVLCCALWARPEQRLLTACMSPTPQVLPAVAVGCLCLVKSGAVMGTYSCHNFEKNIKSAWERENSLPGTDGIPIEVKERRKKEKERKAREEEEKKRNGGELT